MLPPLSELEVRAETIPPSRTANLSVVMIMLPAGPDVPRSLAVNIPLENPRSLTPESVRESEALIRIFPRFP
jgi:hypothetical protein